MGNVAEALTVHPHMVAGQVSKCTCKIMCTDLHLYSMYVVPCRGQSAPAAAAAQEPHTSSVTSYCPA